MDGQLVRHASPAGGHEPRHPLIPICPAHMTLPAAASFALTETPTRGLLTVRESPAPESGPEGPCGALSRSIKSCGDRRQEIPQALPRPRAADGCCGIGAVIGTGIFVLTATAAQKAGPGMMVSFVIAGLVCALAAPCYLRAGVDGAGRRFRLHLVLRRHGRTDGLAGRLGADPRICAGRFRRGGWLVRPYRRPARFARDAHTARLHGGAEDIARRLPGGRRSRRRHQRARRADHHLRHHPPGDRHP